MKFLKKINKGLLLTILVLAILITYIVVVEIQRNGEKDIIKEACERYIDFENKYTVIPKEYRNQNGKVSNEKVEEYKIELEKELKNLMIKDENIYNQQKNIVEDKLENQIDAFEIYISKLSKVLKVSKYEFDLDQVVVTIENTLETEYIDNTDNFNKKTNKTTNKYEDTITLKRENGTWKIVFADIESSFSETGLFF